MKLGIVVGHTHDAPGAVLCRPFEYVSEYEYNTLLAAMMVNYARGMNIATFVSFRDRVGIAGAHRAIALEKCTACIELHFNSFDSTTEGTETLYGSIDQSRNFADIAQLYMCEVFERKGKSNRGTKFLIQSDRGGANVNQPTQVPTILVEPFFGSDPDEAQRALEKMPELAKALIESFKKFEASKLP